MQPKRFLQCFYNKAVNRALQEPLVDIGHIDKEDLKELKYAVNINLLDKGKGGGYPVIKTVYAKKGFDFEADRIKQVNEILDMSILLGEKVIHNEVRYNY